MLAQVAALAGQKVNSEIPHFVFVIKYLQGVNSNYFASRNRYLFVAVSNAAAAVSEAMSRLRRCLRCCCFWKHNPRYMLGDKPKCAQPNV